MTEVSASTDCALTEGPLTDRRFTSSDKLLAEMRSGESLDWDIIIIGGGITGAGILREAVRRGYSALLLCSLNLGHSHITSLV